MVGIMLFLANQGADVVRLDAVAFMSKREGARCQSEPEAHELLQALRAAGRIVAPALIHKEEAIVAPKELIPYLGLGTHAGHEGNLTYAADNGTALVALHGSWNRAEPSGYEIVRLRFGEGSQITHEPFLGGCVAGGKPICRPTDILEAPDDAKGTICRIVHQ